MYLGNHGIPVLKGLLLLHLSVLLHEQFVLDSQLTCSLSFRLGFQALFFVSILLIVALQGLSLDLQILAKLLDPLDELFTFL
jgi:hypothetical protein